LRTYFAPTQRIELNRGSESMKGHVSLALTREGISKMSVLFALMLAASPATPASEAPQKKPRLKCEWIHEVGTSRPRRVCEKRVEKPKPADQATEAGAQQPAVDAAAEPKADHSQHQTGTPQ